MSQDKGYGTCTIVIADQNISVTTLHLLPFRAFGVELDSEIGKTILSSIETAIMPSEQTALIQGDFNIDSEQLAPILPALLTDNMDEVLLNEPTTPVGRRYDHVFYKSLILENMKVDSSVKTDHYPVTCEFSVTGS